MALNKWWFRSRLATAALLFSAALFVFAVSSGLAPCSRVFAQTTSCNVGDTEVFTGPTSFNNEIRVGATPTAGDANQFIRSSGTGLPPEWTDFGVIKTADQTVNNSATLVNDDELFSAVTTNAQYLATALLIITSDTTADFKFQFTVPSGATLDGASVDCEPQCAQGNIFDESAATSVLIGSGTLLTIKMQFVVQTGANAGNVQLQWAQNTMNASDTIMKAGSSWTITRLS